MYTLLYTYGTRRAQFLYSVCCFAIFTWTIIDVQTYRLQYNTRHVHIEAVTRNQGTSDCTTHCGTCITSPSSVLVSIVRGRRQTVPCTMHDWIFASLSVNRRNNWFWFRRCELSAPRVYTASSSLSYIYIGKKQQAFMSALSPVMVAIG